MRHNGVCAALPANWKLAEHWVLQYFVPQGDWGKTGTAHCSIGIPKFPRPHSPSSVCSAAHLFPTSTFFAAANFKYKMYCTAITN